MMRKSERKGAAIGRLFATATMEHIGELRATAGDIRTPFARRFVADAVRKCRADGASFASIAAWLNVSPSTVARLAKEG